MAESVETLAARLAAVEAERAIERLIYTYGHMLDFGSPEAYADLFTSDGRVEIQSGFINLFGLDFPVPYESEGLSIGGVRRGNAMVFSGRETLMRFAAKPLSPTRTLHVVSQPLVTLEGPERASAESYMRVFARNPEGGPELQAFGRYLDAFHKTDAGWRFVARICEV